MEAFASLLKKKLVIATSKIMSINEWNLKEISVRSHKSNFTTQ